IHFDVSNTVLLDFDVMSNSSSSYASILNIEVGEEKKVLCTQNANEDQWMYVIEGEGEINVGGESYLLFPQRVVFIEAGAEHTLINSGSKPLRTIKICASRGAIPEMIGAF